MTETFSSQKLVKKLFSNDAELLQTQISDQTPSWEAPQVTVNRTTKPQTKFL